MVFSATDTDAGPEITGAVLARVKALTPKDQPPVPSLLVARATAVYRVLDLSRTRWCCGAAAERMGGAGGARRGVLAAELAGDSPSSRAPEVQYCSWYPVMPAPLDGTVQEASRFLWPPLEGTLKVNLGVPGGPTSVTLTVTARLADLVEGASSAAFTVTLYWVVPLS